MRKNKRNWVELYDEELAERVAYVMGSSSAASLALAELRRRREAGEKVSLYRTATSVLVGPSPEPFQTGS